MSDNSISQQAILARFLGTQGSEPAPPDLHYEDQESQPHDPSQLSPTDNAQYLHIKAIHMRFEDYCHMVFNFASLKFVATADNVPTSTPIGLNNEDDAVLSSLDPISTSTKQLLYRVQGFRELIIELESLSSSVKWLEFQRVNLKARILTELEQLLAGVNAEKVLHADGIKPHEPGTARRIHLASSSPPERTLFPIATAIVILIAVIHCMMGVAREHCNFILKCLRSILQLAWQVQDSRYRLSTHLTNNIPITLPTALHYLGLQDHLDVYVVCPTCNSTFKDDMESDIPDKCPSVNVDGMVCNTELYKHHHRGNRTWRKPIRRFSHQPLESWLSRFLNRPGIEDMLESTFPTSQDACTDVWGASFLANFPARDQTGFFHAPREELRLAFLVYHDFFNPYSNMISGKKRSIGLVMMVCLNLPPDIRYDLKNIYVTAMIPGPKEPALEGINQFVRPIAENLEEHYSPGVYITKTHKYPRGRKVCSAAPISSMDIPASRAWGGIGGHSHTQCCSFCDATLSSIDNFDLSSCQQRSMDQHRMYARKWLEAKSSKERDLIWKIHAARHSEWLRFDWFNVFTGTTIAPMHWTKNVAERQIRDNMGCSATIPAGIPQPPPLSRPISMLELEWGRVAMLYLGAEELERSKLPEPLLRYMCRERGIFEAGLASKRLTQELNQWRMDRFELHVDGSPVLVEPENVVATAKAYYYLSKSENKASLLDAHSTVTSLTQLCDKFSIPWSSNDRKAELIQRLMEYHKDIRVPNIKEAERSKRHDVVLLGKEVVAQIKLDMQGTTLPSWIKTPPVNFATTDHGKIGAEEYKSLSIISLPVTLIRLWNNASKPYQERLNHFLHLSLAIRVLAYQALTEHDILLFEHHYSEYLHGLKSLYPFSSIAVVQHLGIHIPYFLRTLGPSTRYSENTCEMFIGMLEEIPTNSKIGELEQTLHKELIMAANLKALMEQKNISQDLGPFSDTVSEFLKGRYPGSEPLCASGWQTSHNNETMMLDQPTYDALRAWANNHHIRPLAQNLFTCTKLQRGNVVYQPFSEASGNSCILFSPKGSTTPTRGRIDAILEESKFGLPISAIPHVVLVVREFQNLGPNDARLDPYANHVLVGKPRFGIMSLYYDTVNLETAYIIEPHNIISHVAICKYSDPTGCLSAPCIVAIDLNLKHE